MFVLGTSKFSGRNRDLISNTAAKGGMHIIGSTPPTGHQLVYD
jgi:hypothetical protein